MLHYSYLEAIWHFIHYVKNHKQEFIFCSFGWLKFTISKPMLYGKTETQQVCPRLWQKQILVHEHIQNVQVLKNRISTNVWFHVDNSWMTKQTLTDLYSNNVENRIFSLLRGSQTYAYTARIRERGSKNKWEWFKSRFRCRIYAFVLNIMIFIFEEFSNFAYTTKVRICGKVPLWLKKAS